MNPWNDPSDDAWDFTMGIGYSHKELEVFILEVLQTERGRHAAAPILANFLHREKLATKPLENDFRHEVMLAWDNAH